MVARSEVTPPRRADGDDVATLAALFLVAAGASVGAGKKPTLTFTSGVHGAGGNCASQNPIQGLNFFQYPLAYATLIHRNVDGTLGSGLASSWRYIREPAGTNRSFELTLCRDPRFSARATCGQRSQALRGS